MNIRTTIALAAILGLVIIISVIYINSRDDDTPEQVAPRQEFFYLVDDDDIRRATITHLGQTRTFVADNEGQWHFDTPTGEPVNMERWGGVTLLLSGPQYKRLLVDRATDLARYGLDNPQTVIRVGLLNPSNQFTEIEIKLGDQTADGSDHYAQYQQGEAIYLIDSSWGDVLSRLVTEPPFNPTPTPVVTPGGIETPGAEVTPEATAPAGTPAQSSPSPEPSPAPAPLATPV